jgi:hypothetical protein
VNTKEGYVVRTGALGRNMFGGGRLLVRWGQSAIITAKRGINSNIIADLIPP